jgi:hypothetical protein
MRSWDGNALPTTELNAQTGDHRRSGNRAGRIGIAFVIALLPLVVAFAISRTLFDASVQQALPLINDEVAYWNQIATFTARSFSGGYITVDERPSRVGWSHFGPHGPAFAVLYGLPAKVFGWGYSSGPVFGAIAFCLAAMTFIVLTRPPRLLIAALLASYWPLVVVLPSTMQEPLHFAIGCGLAALLFRVLSDEDDATPARSLAAVVFALGLASLVRPVWALLGITLGWYAGKRWGRWPGVFGLAAGVAFMGVCYAVFMSLASPFPTGNGSPQVADLLRDPRDAVRRVIRRTTVESPEDWLFKEAAPLERLVRAELVAIAIVTCVLSLRRKMPDGVRRVDRFVATSIGLLIAAVLALGNIGSWQDFRATTPLLLTLLLLCALTRPRLTWIAVAVHVIAVPIAVSGFERLHDTRFSQARRDAVDEFARRTHPFITYDPTVSPWGNTLLVHADRYQAPLMALPPGVGASSVVYWDRVELPLRSRYVLLSASELEKLGARVHLRRLADTSIGQLFENLDWQR